MADPVELRLDIFRPRHIAVVEMAEIELHARLEAPFQRHFVDPPGGLAAFLQRMVHRREEMPGRVQVRAVMGGDADLLDGGVFAVRQRVHADAEIFGHGGRGVVVVQIVDLRQHVRRIARNAGLQRDGNIDDTTAHACPPLAGAPARNTPVV